MNLRRILIAVDDSPPSAHAADVGIELARSLQGEIALVHAIDPAGVFSPEGGVPAAELRKLAEEDGRRLLAEFRARATLAGPPMEFAPFGNPAAEVVKTAREWPADIIVIASHGRGGLSRLLLGSIAEGVVRHAPCPVLVVRAPA